MLPFITTLAFSCAFLQVAAQNLPRACGSELTATGATVNVAGAVDQPVVYLLITSEQLAPRFQSLVDRRTSLGKPGQFLTTQSIYDTYDGADNPAKIRNCIKHYRANHGTLWVALGGDETVVPVRYCRPVPKEPNTFVPADLYYSDTDGGTWDANGNGIYGEVGDVSVADLTPEVHIGRIPVSSVQQVADYIDKVIAYENASPDGFARSMLYLCADEPTYSGNARPLEYRQHDPVGNGDFGYTMWYWDKIQPYWQAYPMHGLFATHTSWDENDWGDYDLTAEHLSERLNQGYHFVTFSGHMWSPDDPLGGGWGLETEAFWQSDAMNLTNSIPFIVHSGGCGPAWFDRPGDCLGEAFLHNPIGGAVVFFGYARSIGIEPLNHHDVLFEEMFKNGYRNVGKAFTECKLIGAPLCVNAPYSQLIYTLLGDPGLEMHWDETGRHVQIDVPSGLEVYDLNADMSIRWNAAGTGFVAGEQVRLEYSCDSGASWQTIPGAGQLRFDSSPFVWPHPSLPEGPNYRIRVVSLADPSVSSGSRKDFTVHSLGLLTVQTTPAHRFVSIQGTQPNIAPYTFTVMLNSQVTLIAPAKAGFLGDLGFVDWINSAGEVLTTNTTLDFTFTQDASVVARYEYRGPAKHHFVNDDVAEPGFAAGNDSNDGLSMQTPMRHIQTLLDRYHTLGWGGIVHVSEGTYAENINIAPDHTLGTDIDHSGVTLSGAGPGKSVIDGTSIGSCMKIIGTSQICIDGFTVRNGDSDIGGGVLWGDTTGSLNNCSLEHSNAWGYGAGLAVTAGSQVSISNCRFEHNTTDYDGAGLAIREKSTISIDRCRFEQNRAGRHGGALYVENDSSLSISNTLLAGCEALYGAGAYSYHSALDAGHCTFYKNTAASRGGAIYSVGLSPVLTNCVLWHDEPQELSSEIGTPLLTYCDVEGGWSGTGNIVGDPLFVRPAGLDGDPDTLPDNDYHIRFQSPCRDAGDPSFLPASQDMDCDGQPRVMSTRIDIGADEAPIPGDSDYDNDIDEDDSGRFESCGSGPAIQVTVGCEWADFDYDGDVDQSDFAILQRCYSGENVPADPNCGS